VALSTTFSLTLVNDDETDAGQRRRTGARQRDERTLVEALV